MSSDEKPQQANEGIWTSAPLTPVPEEEGLWTSAPKAEPEPGNDWKPAGPSGSTGWEEALSPPEERARRATPEWDPALSEAFAEKKARNREIREKRSIDTERQWIERQRAAQRRQQQGSMMPLQTTPTQGTTGMGPIIALVVVLVLVALAQAGLI